VLFHRSVDIICGLLFYPPFTTALYGGPLFGQPLRNDIGGVLFGCILRAAIYGGARCLLTGSNLIGGLLIGLPLANETSTVA